MKVDSPRGKGRLVSRKNPANVILLAMLIVTGFAPAASGGEEASFSWGFRQRIREAYIQNGLDVENDLADDRHYIRVRSQLWGSYFPFQGWKIHVLLNNEHRHWFKSNQGLEDKDFEIDEFIFENLYLSIDRINGSHISIIAGRQNIMYGEGFLFMDGGPLDGSRTAYCNALRIKLANPERSLEFHLLSNPHKDNYLPVVNCQTKDLIEKDESGAGLHYLDKSIPKLDIAGYYFFKREELKGSGLDKADIHTLGARVSSKMTESFSFTSEWAFQLGDLGSRRGRAALGGYIHGSYSVPLSLDPLLTAGVIYLSGNKSATGTYEGWNPLYGRWPKWSELYIYTLARENGVAYWDNLFAPHLKLDLKPVKRISLEGTLYYLGAVHSNHFAGAAAGSPAAGRGTRRGILSLIKLKWSAGAHVSGHLLWERLAPGDYYIDGSDVANFLRWELMYHF
ncbi:MAG: alginate export family protein [Candidatus Krumholzibacteriota bacterium]|nr:alginate export family protein [Candidatus Krumholzibacteriota bacterium]